MKSNYNNNLNDIAKRRICFDRNIVLNGKDEYIENGIYFNFNELIDNKFKILIIGSDEISNPYFGGFFFFSGIFPNEYPFYPPHILAKTQGEETRFHPNFYISGKCCLSILGTWVGPPWTSCQNISTVSLALKSLFIDNPITQEPGFENCNDSRSLLYRRVIEYRTLKIAVLSMLNTPPEEFKGFLPIMEKKFIELYPKFDEKLNNLMKYNNKSFKSPIYNSKNNMIQTYDVEGLKQLFLKKYNELTKKYKLIKSINVDSKLKYNRKCPSKLSKLYDIGYKQISENDNNWWIVKANKNGIKRWVKLNI